MCLPTKISPQQKFLHLRYNSLMVQKVNTIIFIHFKTLINLILKEHVQKMYTYCLHIHMLLCWWWTDIKTKLTTSLDIPEVCCLLSAMPAKPYVHSPRTREQQKKKQRIDSATYWQWGQDTTQNNFSRTRNTLSADASSPRLVTEVFLCFSIFMYLSWGEE